MACVVVEVDGQPMMLCGRGLKPMPPCRFCGAHSTVLCDFPVRDRADYMGAIYTPRRRTCDAPICENCATSIGPNSDLCPVHKKEWTGTAGKP